MTFEQIADIMEAPKNLKTGENMPNRYLFHTLDLDSVDLIARVMEVLPAKAFQELNADADFEIINVPLPISSLPKGEVEVKLSEEIEGKIKNLLPLINADGTNKEYPYVFMGENGDILSKMHKMEVGEDESCAYDWDWIENEIATNENLTDIALFHTHPKEISTPHKTLYNKYPMELKKVGVEADGLNLSVSDIYANMYLDYLALKYDREIKTHSLVLMHNGKLIDFSTSDGIKLESETILNKENELEI